MNSIVHVVKSCEDFQISEKSFLPLRVKAGNAAKSRICQKDLTFWRRVIFLILAHPVYKMWIIQEPNTLELWNKLHFEEEKTESIYHV